MKNARSIFTNPYLYIFLTTYYIVWLTWNNIYVPYYNPYQVIGALSKLHYNPLGNILRFGLALLLPPLVCLIYWLIERKSNLPVTRYYHRLRASVLAIIIVVSILLSVGMAIVQSSTSGGNDPTTYGGPYKNTLVDSFHEGETLGPAISYEQKNLKPYKDSVFVHGVFQDPVRSILAFKLFGHSIGAVRAFTAILTIITFILLYLFFLVLFKNVFMATAALLPVALCLLPVLGDTLPSASKLLIGVQLPSLDFATLLFLGFAILGFRAIHVTNKRLIYVYSGIVGFITLADFANSIDRGFFILALSVVWLLLIAISMPIKAFLKTVFASFVCGSVLGIIVLGIALKGDYVDFLKFTLKIGSYKEYLDGYIFARPSLAINVVLVTLAAFITVVGVRIVSSMSSPSTSRPVGFKAKFHLYRGRLSPLIEKHAVLLLLLCTAVFYLRSAIGRADYGHFAYSILWTYILVTYVILKYISTKPAARRVANFLTVILLLGATTYYGVLVKHVDMPKNTFPIHASDKDLVRTDYSQTADYIKHNLSGDQSFMTLTSEGLWYYLVDKPSPVQYPIVWFAATTSQRHRLATQLATNNNIKYVITNNNWTSDIDNVPVRDRIPEVFTVLESQYVPEIGFGQQTIWQRK